MTALGALVAAIASDCVTMPTSTFGADIAVRPLELVQVLFAGFLSGKPFHKLVETQRFLLGHFWHLPFDASIHLLMSDSLDTITISSVVLTKADNLNCCLAGRHALPCLQGRGRGGIRSRQLDTKKGSANS